MFQIKKKKMPRRCSWHRSVNGECPSKDNCPGWNMTYQGANGPEKCVTPGIHRYLRRRRQASRYKARNVPIPAEHKSRGALHWQYYRWIKATDKSDSESTTTDESDREEEEKKEEEKKVREVKVRAQARIGAKWRDFDWGNVDQLAKKNPRTKKLEATLYDLTKFPGELTVVFAKYPRQKNRRQPKRVLVMQNDKSHSLKTQNGVKWVLEYIHRENAPRGVASFVMCKMLNLLKENASLKDTDLLYTAASPSGDSTRVSQGLVDYYGRFGFEEESRQRIEDVEYVIMKVSVADIMLRCRSKFSSL